MKVVHRVQPRTARGERLLRSLGWKDGDAVMLVAESDAHWESVAPAIRAKDLEILVTHHRYTPGELRAAEWLEMSLWQIGYPQPEDDFAYLEATYDDVCRRCGITGRQRAPFRMAREPRWGTRSIMTLHWVHDAVFVKPEICKDVFDPLSISNQAVLDRHGSPLTTVRQVLVSEVVSLEMPSAGRVCRHCNRRRYSPDRAHGIPPLRRAPRTELAHTVEWFGDGGSSHRRIVVSQRLFRRLNEAKVRGAEFSVLRLSELVRESKEQV